MKTYIYTITAALALICSCSKQAEHIVTVTRDTSFTGCGNSSEVLLNAEVEPQEGITLKSIDLTLTEDASAGNITSIQLVQNGQEIARIKVRDGKQSYTLHADASISDTLRFSICADIAAGAEEGSKISADIASMSFSDGDSTPLAPAKGYREVLLARKRLYAPGDFGSKNWRIPALLALKDGSLLAVNDKRKNNEGDLPQDIDIVASRSTDGGKTWSKPVTIVEGKGYKKGYGDPALVQLPDGDILCAFVGGNGLWKSSEDDPISSYICRSHDGGKTWTKPENITSLLWGSDALRRECRKYHGAFFGSGNGLVIKEGQHKGRIIFVSAMATKQNKLMNHAVYSDDGGLSWQVSELAFRGGDEAKVVELNDGRILMSIRQDGARGWNISEDGGETWGRQGKWKDMVTNACDGDIIRCGNVLIHSVPDSMERENVSIFVSTDEGKTWSYKKSLCGYGSVYSSLTILPDGTIGMYLEETPEDECELWYINFSYNWLMSK